LGFPDVLTSGFDTLEPFLGSGRQPQPQLPSFFLVIFFTSFPFWHELFAFEFIEAFLYARKFLFQLIFIGRQAFPFLFGGKIAPEQRTTPAPAASASATSQSRVSGNFSLPTHVVSPPF
jgi:hypothetical protein